MQLGKRYKKQFSWLRIIISVTEESVWFVVDIDGCLHLTDLQLLLEYSTRDLWPIRRQLLLVFCLISVPLITFPSTVDELADSGH